MQPSAKQLPLTRKDRNKVLRKVIIFYVFGVPGVGLVLYALYQIIVGFEYFFLFLLFVGIVLTAALVLAQTWVSKDLKDGKKNIFSGAVIDKQEVYKVKVSTSSGNDTDFKSEYQVKLNDTWHEVPKSIYERISPGQVVNIEKTTQSETYLNTEIIGEAPEYTHKESKKESVEGKTYEVRFTRVTEKINSNVKITRYRPRASKGFPNPYHYLVIADQLYAVPESQYEVIPIYSSAVVFKNEETGKIEKVFTQTTAGEQVEL